jgi:hypothetical protein
MLYDGCNSTCYVYFTTVKTNTFNQSAADEALHWLPSVLTITPRFSPTPTPVRPPVDLPAGPCLAAPHHPGPLSLPHPLSPLGVEVLTLPEIIVYSLILSIAFF